MSSCCPDPGVTTRRGGPDARRRLRVRLMVSIPVITSLPLLVAGLVIRDMGSHAAAPVGTVGIEPVMTVLIVAAVVALLAGVALAYAVTGRLAWLAIQTERISAGDLADVVSPEIPEVPGDEIGLLASSLKHAAESMNRYLLDSMAGGGVMTVDAHGIVTSLNADAELLIGDEVKRLVGRPLAEMPSTAPGSEPFVQAILDAVRQQQKWRAREVSCRIRGRGVTVSLDTTMLCAATGTVTGVIVTFKDMTQIARMREEVRLTQKLTALGAFAMAVGHEVRNPLATIQGLAQLLDQSSTAESRQKSCTEMIIRESRRVVRAVEDLLWFGEPVTGQTVETDLNAIVKGVIAQVAGDSPSARTVDEVYAAGLPRVTLDTKALARAVENLLRHALAASGQQGTVRVQTAVRAGAVHVRISNDGPALPPNEAEAVFDPFSARKGGVLNLGIATANQIVAAHGGQLSLLDNQPGHVTFEVAMPCPEVGGDHARTTG